MRARTAVFWVALAALLSAAAALSAVRLIEPGAGWAIQLEAFTPFGLALYAVALVLTAVRSLTRRRWRSPSGALAVVAAAGLALHCWWFAPMVSGANPPPAAGAETLRVMTANIAQGDGDPFELVRAVSEEHVDLLVVEEINAAALADMDRAGLRDLLPHRAGEPSGGGRGTMVFARDDLGPARPTDTWLDGWVVPVGDLVVVAVHPQAPTEPDLWRSDHAALLDVARTAGADLVVGDLNATVDHAPLRALAEAGWRDAAELTNAGWQPTWPSSGRWRLLVPLPPLAAIDHVLVGPRLAALSMHTVDLPGSDHRAVLAEVAEK